MWAHKKLIAGSLFILLAVGAFIWSKMAQNASQATLTTTSSSGVTQTTTVVNPGSTLAFVRKMNGSVDIKNAVQTTPAAVNTGLNVGDSVITRANSDAEIVFTDNSVVRLAMNSTLTIAASSASSTDLELTEGSLWARILKPLGDRSLFTIKTKDLSAGVRSTSVKVTKTPTKSTVDVIDSYAGTGQTAVEVKYEEQTQQKQEDMNIEEHFEFPYTGSTPKKKLDLAQVFENDPMVRVNTKEDLLYMNELAKKLEQDTQANDHEKARLLKIQWEITQSLPKPEEIKPFFDSSAIEEHVMNLEKPKPTEPTNTQTGTTHDALMQSIQDDMQLVEKRSQLERERDKTSINDPKVANEHQKYINQLENDVRNFDLDWKTKQQELEKQALEKKALEERLAAEKKAFEDAQIQAIEGDRVPNIPTLPPLNTGSLVPVKPAPIPTPTTNPVPKPVSTTPLPIPVEPVVQPVTTTPLPRPVLSGSATINN